MPVSVTMPQLGESVSEGTVTRWLKKEGDHIDTNEPLLEVSTEKVDIEIPSPASGTLQSISVSEDETVEVGAVIGLITEAGDAAATGAAAPSQAPPEVQSDTAEAQPDTAEVQPDTAEAQQPAPSGQQPAPSGQQAAADRPSTVEQATTAQTTAAPPQREPAQQQAQPAQQQAQPAAPPPPTTEQAQPPQQAQPGPPITEQVQRDQQAPAQHAPPPAAPEQVPEQTQQQEGATAGTPYVTPLVRKLAAEHRVDLGEVDGTGVGGRIRKQDVLDAARSREEPLAAPSAPEAAPPAPQPAASAPEAAAQRQATTPQAPAAPQPPSAAPQAPSAAPSPEAAQLRGRTEKMSRTRSVIARRMTESLQVSAQLTTVVEVDVTEVARLRERAKADFKAREGVNLSFLPFFAQATVEALKAHPKLNASIDTENSEITYYDAEHLGIAVDTERGLLVPVIHDAGDLNLGGLARKIADLADRTRAAKVSVDELGGGTFTLTNIGSRGALTDTPIINQPQVGILGTGKVVKRPVVVDDPELGEVFVARSMAYFPLTYDHRLVDGADAARFLNTVKTRLEEGNFEADLGLA